MSFKSKIIDALSENNFLVLSDAILISRNQERVSEVLNLITESNHFNLLSGETIKRINNFNLLKKGLDEKDMTGIQTFLTDDMMSLSDAMIQNSASNMIFDYLSQMDDMEFKCKIIDALSENNFIVMAEAVLKIRDGMSDINILTTLMESRHAHLIPDLIEKMNNILLIKRGLDNQDIDGIKNLLSDFRINAEDFSNRNTVSEMIYRYLLDQNDLALKSQIINVLSKDSFMVMAKEMLETWFSRSGEVYKLFVRSDNFNTLPQHLGKKLEDKSGLTKEQENMEQDGGVLHEYITSGFKK